MEGDGAVVGALALRLEVDSHGATAFCGNNTAVVLYPIRHSNAYIGQSESFCSPVVDREGNPHRRAGRYLTKVIMLRAYTNFRV